LILALAWFKEFLVSAISVFYGAVFSPIVSMLDTSIGASAYLGFEVS
jgi:hypothetical protein